MSVSFAVRPPELAAEDSSEDTSALSSSRERRLPLSAPLEKQKMRQLQFSGRRSGSRCQEITVAVVGSSLFSSSCLLSSCYSPGNFSRHLLGLFLC